MIGRMQLAALVIDDVVASCGQATLCMQSDGCWHIELDATNTPALSGSQRKYITLVTTDGDELTGEVRVGPRRLFPFNRTVILEGVHPLERLDTAAIA